MLSHAFGILFVSLQMSLHWVFHNLFAECSLCMPDTFHLLGLVAPPPPAEAWNTAPFSGVRRVSLSKMMYSPECYHFRPLSWQWCAKNLFKFPVKVPPLDRYWMEEQLLPDCDIS